jgi:hypothetical protein
MFLFSLCLIGEWGGESLWGGVRDGGCRRTLSIVVFFSRGSQRMDGGGKYEKRERKRTENERERERRERGNNTLFLLFLHTLVASIATIFATICCGATIVCCHL